MLLQANKKQQLFDKLFFHSEKKVAKLNGIILKNTSFETILNKLLIGKNIKNKNLNLKHLNTTNTIKFLEQKKLFNQERSSIKINNENSPIKQKRQLIFKTDDYFHTKDTRIKSKRKILIENSKSNLKKLYPLSSSLTPKLKTVANPHTSNKDYKKTNKNLNISRLNKVNEHPILNLKYLNNLINLKNKLSKANLWDKHQIKLSKYSNLIIANNANTVENKHHKTLANPNEAELKNKTFNMDDSLFTTNKKPVYLLSSKKQKNNFTKNFKPTNESLHKNNVKTIKTVANPNIDSKNHKEVDTDLNISHSNKVKKPTILNFKHFDNSLKLKNKLAKTYSWHKHQIKLSKYNNSTDTNNANTIKNKYPKTLAKHKNKFLSTDNNNNLITTNKELVYLQFNNFTQNFNYKSINLNKNYAKILKIKTAVNLNTSNKTNKKTFNGLNSSHSHKHEKLNIREDSPIPLNNANYINQKQISYNPQITQNTNSSMHFVEEKKGKSNLSKSKSKTHRQDIISKNNQNLYSREIEKQSLNHNTDTEIPEYNNLLNHQYYTTKAEENPVNRDTDTDLTGNISYETSYKNDNTDFSQSYDSYVTEAKEPYTKQRMNNNNQIKRIINMKIAIENTILKASLVNNRFNLTITSNNLNNIANIKTDIENIISEAGFKDFKVEFKDKRDKAYKKENYRAINVKA